MQLRNLHTGAYCLGSDGQIRGLSIVTAEIHRALDLCEAALEADPTMLYFTNVPVGPNHTPRDEEIRGPDLHCHHGRTADEGKHNLSRELQEGFSIVSKILGSRLFIWI